MASWRTKRTTTIVALTLALTGCWFGGDDDDTVDDADARPPVTTVATGSRPDVTPDVHIEGVATVDPVQQLGLTLSEGSPSDENTTAVEVVDGTPIDPADVEAIIDRLPPWDVPASDRTEFERPAQTLPPPLVGETIDGVFPPPGDDPPPESAEGPLEVVRFQPEGEVDVAPFLSVTFDQPMVPLGTLDQLDELDVPVVVSPAIEGRWRWIGTRTLRFEVTSDELDRLPAATDYEVTVPAGTTSVSGGRLAESVTWTFTTPAPSVESFVGEAETTSLLPVFVAVFDQRVDAEAVLSTTTVEVDGRSVPVRVATDDEIAADDAAAGAVAGALDSRAVAFRPVTELPADAPFTVTIGPDTPSAEGPRTSDRAATFRGRTFGSLEVSRTDCGGGGGCEPGTPFIIEFSNALDAELFAADLIDVEPAIEQLTINVYGSVVELSGATHGRTTYQVQLDGSLTDVFGQTLGQDTTVDFRVGSARPALLGLPREWITTDPTAEQPRVSVTTVNHDSVRVRAWAVSPADIESFRSYLERLWSDEDAEAPEWPVVTDEVIEIDAEQDRYVETSIDLSDAFDQVDSQIVVRIDPMQEFSTDDDDYWRNRPTVAWVQSTTVGIDAIFDHERLVIWTTDLATGEPLDGVPVELIGDGRVATTDSGGLAELDIGDTGILGLWANAGNETAFLPADWYEGWKASERADEGRWYVFDDRGVYRPGETVRLTGWVRKLAWSTEELLELYDGEASVRYDAWDAQGNELATGTVDLNALGGFNLTLDVPEGANLGQALVELRTPGSDGDDSSTSHSFSIQEFRRPQFEVTATNESEGPFFVGQPSTVRVDAAYFSGGPLPEADVSWLVSKRETTYRPPNWDEYTFGVWVPWWEVGRSGGGTSDVAADTGAAEASEPCFDCWPGAPTEYEEFTGTTDASGSHYLRIDFDGPEVDLPTTVTAEATVFDVDRQAWSSRTDLLVHAAEQYVGLRSDRAFVRQGTPIRVDGIVTDVDGDLVPGRDVTVTAGRLEWVLAGGDWTERVADEETCTFTSTADAADTSMRCEFSTEVGGSYRITATVVDEAGHTNRTQLTQWVSGATGRPVRDLEQGIVTIVPDRETYAPGDTAELLVQAPFAPATGIVTIARGGIVSTEPFDAEDGSAVLEIPIEEAHVPNIEIQVDMVGAAVRVDDDGNQLPDLPEQPAFATGHIGVSVPPVTRALDVVVTPADTALRPGEDTSVTVAVTDADGEPVDGADVAIVVVDEAVLSLTGYELADPLDVFYSNVWTELNSKYMRSSILLTRADLLEPPAGGRADEAEGAGTDGGEEVAGDSADSDDAPASGAPSDTGAIDVRENFDALAVYAPSESTDADGEVTVDVPLPDSLTRYRVMAVAIDGAERFGKGESTITARLPLQVRPSPPRFLNFGDQVDLPVVLQNQTDDPLEVDVAIESANLELTGVVGRTVTVPPNDRIEVRFPATTDQVGTARFRVVAVSTEFSDAAAVDLPVYTPATAEAFATYGVVDEGAVAQPTTAPTDVFPQFGGLEINTSSTALQALTDAVIYLTDYRYESSDGLASRIMAIATLRDVLDAFDAEGLPPPAELDAAVRADVDALAALQNDDGGFPYWQRGRESVPWQSIQATHALVLARQADYPVSDEALDHALEHLGSIEQYIPSTYSEQVRNSLIAYALYVRGEAGRADAAAATELYRRAGDELELDAVAWLWPSIVDADLRAEIERRILNAAVETAGAATFATSYGEDAYVIANSERKTDGIILDALISEAPGSDLIPKVVAGLLGGQTRGRWNNAHENAFILVALDGYFDTFESVTPAFVARVWLGDLYAAEATFDGRTTDRVNTLVPMPQVIAAGDASVVVSKEGEGRLYYRLGLRYAPTDLRPDPRDEGFVVERVYEAIDDPDDVRRSPDGSWTIRAGAKVRVSLTMVADARRTHVALVDPLPAGLEPVDPALTVSQTTPPSDPDDGAGAGAGDGDGDGGPGSWFCCWNWFEHQNLRDDRAEAFTAVLPGGTYEYSYIARATTPGTFVVPPPRAEEIYSPEVFGRGAGATVVVE